MEYAGLGRRKRLRRPSDWFASLAVLDSRPLPLTDKRIDKLKIKKIKITKRSILGVFFDDRPYLFLKIQRKKKKKICILCY